MGMGGHQRRRDKMVCAAQEEALMVLVCGSSPENKRAMSSSCRKCEASPKKKRFRFDGPQRRGTVEVSATSKRCAFRCLTSAGLESHACNSRAICDLLLSARCAFRC